MAQVYFHCSNARGVLLDRRGAEIEDMDDVHQHANRVVRSLINSPGTEDWRNWVLHVSDDLGEEIFVFPFKTMIGRMH
jgi:hypothetical protein